MRTKKYKRLIIVAILILFYGCSGGGGDGGGGSVGGGINDDPIDGYEPLSQNYTADYTYDELGRIKMIRYENGQSISYAYDASGNLIQAAVEE